MTNQPVNRDQVLERARVLHAAGQLAEAETAVLSLVTAGSGSSEVFRLLAQIQHARNDPAREAAAIEQALATSRAEADANEVVRLWARLGSIRIWQGNPVGALAAYQRATGITPWDRESLQGIVRASFDLRDLEGASRAAQELERQYPNDAQSHLAVGHVRKACGEAEAASASYMRALACDPNLGEALYNLVDITVPALGTDLACRVGQLSSRTDIPAADQINANFAHARILDAAGDYSRAFKAFRRANELARNDLGDRNIRYDPRAADEYVNRTVSQYTSLSFTSSVRPLSIELVPIFVIGLPRSGTTLVEQILASHSQAAAAGEIAFAPECEHRFRQARLAAGRTGPVEPSDETDLQLLERAREQYLERLFERGLDAERVIDKLPANFEIAGFLRLIFPQAPIIHCVRDPRANCFSLYCANFASHEPWYHDLHDLAHFYCLYHRLMEHWKKVVPAPFADVVYEQLVTNPDAQIPLVLAAAGLPFESACLEFYRYRRPILTASHSQVRRPMYTSSISHWSKYARWLGPIQSLPTTCR